MHQRKQRISPRVIDAFVVGAVGVPAVLGLAIAVAAGGIAPGDIPWPALPLAVLQAAALWWRRRHPLAVFLTTLIVVLLGRALGDPNATSYVGPLAAGYAVAVYGSQRDAVMAAAALTITALVDIALAEARADPASVVFLTQVGVTVVLAWGIGRYVRVRRDYLDMLVAQAHQLEVEQDERARRAVSEERRRIARELHDQVAHHLGVAALQTGAARRWINRDTERAGSAMASAEEAVREALTTMPVILETLRSEEPAGDLSPQPRLRDIAALATRVSATGLRVEVQTEGDERPLSPAVELAVYRIAQEALTNAMKHADASRCTVLLRFRADGIEVAVKDDGRGNAPAESAGGVAPARGSGLGLVGMRERVESLGGTLVARTQDTGFEVRAVLPAEPQQGSSP